MTHILHLWLVAPLSIYLGLNIFKSVVLTFILFYGVICLGIPVMDLILIQKKRVKDYFREIGFLNFKKAFHPSFVFGLIFCLSVYLFFVLLRKYVLDIGQIQSVLDQWRINNKYLIPFMVTMIFANSVFEEIYWRGYIYRKLQRNVSSTKLLVLTSLFYASYHLITTFELFSILFGLIFTSIIFLVGFFWGYMRKRYDSIYFPIISHLMADLGIMMIYFKYFGR